MDTQRPIATAGNPGRLHARRMDGALRRAGIFLSQALRHPLSVGTLLESSPAVVRRVVAAVDWSGCHGVVELGPGTGAVTRGLLDSLPPTARLLAIETSDAFVAALRSGFRDPRLAVLHGSAVQLARHLRDSGMPRVDAVVSGIPFSTMPRALRAAVLDAVRDALAPDGRLVVYQHSARVLPLLRARFASVQCQTEWRSLWPMRLFVCGQPLAGPSGRLD